MGNLLQRNTVDASSNSNPGAEFYQKRFGTVVYGPGKPHAFTSADGSDATDTRTVAAVHDNAGNMSELTTDRCQ